MSISMTPSARLQKSLSLMNSATSWTMNFMGSKRLSKLHELVPDDSVESELHVHGTFAIKPQKASSSNPRKAQVRPTQRCIRMNEREFRELVETREKQKEEKQTKSGFRIKASLRAALFTAVGQDEHADHPHSLKAVEKVIMGTKAFASCALLKKPGYKQAATKQLSRCPSEDTRALPEDAQPVILGSKRPLQPAAGAYAAGRSYVELPGAALPGAAMPVILGPRGVVPAAERGLQGTTKDSPATWTRCSAATGPLVGPFQPHTPRTILNVAHEVRLSPRIARPPPSKNSSRGLSQSRSTTVL